MCLATVGAAGPEAVARAEAAADGAVEAAGAAAGASGTGLRVSPALVLEHLVVESANHWRSPLNE